MYNLCCISNELKDQGHSFKTMTWKQFTSLSNQHGDEYALNELGKRWLNNIDVTLKTIQFCANNGWGYRVSSSLFPILTHPDFQYKISDVPQYDEIMGLFDDCLANDAWQVRLSMHPDQFVVLASENQDAVDKSIAELNHHGWVMDRLGCQRNYYNPINIHVNCTKGNLADIAYRFMSNLNKCDQSVVSRLVVENEDKGCWTVGNLLHYFDIPVTFDNLHHKCNPSGEFEPMQTCAYTWLRYGVKPLFHYSESHPDKTNPRSHADIPTDCPTDFDADFDIELKEKDLAIRHLYAIQLTREAQDLGFYG